MERALGAQGHQTGASIGPGNEASEGPWDVLGSPGSPTQSRILVIACTVTACTVWGPQGVGVAREDPEDLTGSTCQERKSGPKGTHPLQASEQELRHLGLRCGTGEGSGGLHLYPFRV